MTLRYVAGDRVEDAERRLRIDVIGLHDTTDLIKDDPNSKRVEFVYQMGNLHGGGMYYYRSKPFPYWADGKEHTAHVRQKMMIPTDHFIGFFARNFEHTRGRPATKDEIEQYVSDIMEAFQIIHRSRHGKTPGPVPEPEIVWFEGTMSEDEIYRELNLDLTDSEDGRPASHTC